MKTILLLLLCSSCVDAAEPRLAAFAGGSYETLLDVFWHNIAPTTKDREFVDEGHQYRTAVFADGPEQMRAALESKAKWEKSGVFGAPIVTEVVPAGPFYPAEDYHQDYYKKNPARYHFYRWNSGRDQYLKGIWAQRPK